MPSSHSGRRGWSAARRWHKSQAIKNPKEVNFAWGFSVLVVPGTEPNHSLQAAYLLGLCGSLVCRCPQKCPQNKKCPPVPAPMARFAFAFFVPAPACCQAQWWFRVTFKYPESGGFTAPPHCPFSNLNYDGAKIWLPPSFGHCACSDFQPALPVVLGPPEGRPHCG